MLEQVNHHIELAVSYIFFLLFEALESISSRLPKPTRLPTFVGPTNSPLHYPLLLGQQMWLPIFSRTPSPSRDPMQLLPRRRSLPDAAPSPTSVPCGQMRASLPDATPFLTPVPDNWMRCSLPDAGAPRPTCLVPFRACEKEKRWGNSFFFV
jgi:hypothetical protein